MAIDDKAKREDVRKLIYSTMIEEAKKKGYKIETHAIKFTNNDVPNFLKKLDKFEEISKKSNFLVGYLIPELRYA